MSRSRRWVALGVATGLVASATSCVGSGDGDPVASLPASAPVSSITDPVPTTTASGEVTAASDVTSPSSSTNPTPDATVDAGALTATAGTGVWRLAFSDDRNASVLDSIASGSIQVVTDDGRSRSTRLLDWRRVGTRVVATVGSGGGSAGDIGGPDLRVTLDAFSDGVIAVSIRAQAADVRRIAVEFAADRDERFFGLGQRATGTDHRGRSVENRVLDGPYRTDQVDIVEGLIPKPGFSARKDATYFPVPWVLSSHGYGVLVDNDHTSRFELAVPRRPDRWRVEVDASRLDLRVFAGPRPADALERMSAAVGRQPPPAAPFVLGPWWQPDDDEVAELAAIQRADVPVSLAQTYTHYLPCGDHRGRRAAERARTKRMHGAGMAVTTYVNPMVCTDFESIYERGAEQGAFTKRSDGSPYHYRYSTATQFDVAQFDFSADAGRELFRDVLALTVADGYDGWMEDFGEYTPRDAVSSDGTPGAVMHNRYVEQYHATAREYAEATPRPIARFNRSGWTGAITHSQIVWGGDPTATWGFDGLTSAVYSGLGMGLSGVGLWGSDIGGFFIWPDDELTPELLNRWIQFGALSGVMRLQSGGISLSPVPRAQVLDPAVLAVWRRYSKLRTQLYPYIAGSQESYQATGMPLMRHLVLTAPDDPEAVARDDQYMFGADLLVAPVVRPGSRRRHVYLPAGQWIDLWRSTVYRERDGSLMLGDVMLRSGGEAVAVAAPSDEIPIHVRSGAVLPMLPADVDTLADYGAGTDVVRLADRDDRRVLLAFPGQDWSGPLGPGETLDARSDGDRWMLDVRSSTARTYELQASLTGLAFEPCTVTVDADPVAYTYDTRAHVLRADITLPGNGTITIEACPMTFLSSNPVNVHRI